jgi:hypothetical protein
MNENDEPNTSEPSALAFAEILDEHPEIDPDLGFADALGPNYVEQLVEVP